MFYDLIIPFVIALELVVLQNLDGVTTQSVVMSIFFLILLEAGYLWKKWLNFAPFLLFLAGLFIWPPANGIAGRVCILVCFIIVDAVLFVVIQQLLMYRNKLHETEDLGHEKERTLREQQRRLAAETEEREHVAILTERNRIARDIHDHVGHMLSRGILLLGAIRTVNSDENIAPQLDMLDQTLNDAMKEMRESVHDLHDDAIDINKAVAEIVKELPESDFEVSTDIDAEMLLANEAKLALLGILREAVANIAHHSSGHQVEVVLHQSFGHTQLTVSDDGKVSEGDARKVQEILETDDRRGSGIGLLNIRDRVNALGGSFHVYTDQGFKLFMRIPVVNK